LNNSKIELYRSQDLKDYGDAGKFYAARNFRGYYLSCDDDIVYPHNHVESMINSIEKYNKKAIVGYHGVIINNLNFKSYYSSRRVYHFNSELEKDTLVHILGTGILGFHTDNVKISIEEFPIKNMADIWLGSKSQAENIPMVCVRRDSGLFNVNELSDVDSIYKNSKNKLHSSQNTLDHQNNEIIKKLPWKIVELK
jgi:hypothetical protein